MCDTQCKNERPLLQIKLQLTGEWLKFLKVTMKGVNKFSRHAAWCVMWLIRIKQNQDPLLMGSSEGRRALLKDTTTQMPTKMRYKIFLFGSLPHLKLHRRMLYRCCCLDAHRWADLGDSHQGSMQFLLKLRTCFIVCLSCRPLTVINEKLYILDRLQRNLFAQWFNLIN